MKKILLSLTVIICLMTRFAPVANSQALCGAGFTYVIGTITPNGAQVVFNDSSYAFGTITSWSWSFGNGTGSTAQNPTGFLNPGGNYVCLTITSMYQNQPCTSTWCDSIYIGTPPPPVCNAVFTYAVSPQGVQFSGPAGNNVSWTWSFGDGTSGTGINPFHVYNSSGNYTVCLTVTEANGVSCTSCQSVSTANTGNCTAYFTSSIIPGTTVVNFTDLSSGNAQYFYWTFGDGSNSTSQNPTHAYSTAGAYYVCLSIIDSIAGCSDTYCDSLYIGGGFLCNPSFGFQSSPAGTTFNATSQNGVTYTWDFGDGTTGTGAVVNHFYATPGTYIACLTVTGNGLTCSSCQTVVIQNAPGCSSNFAVYPDSLLLHTYYAYNLASGIGPLSYTWSWGDGTSSTGAYPSHTYASAGLYTICLTITDASGCTSNTCYQWQLLRLASGTSSVPVTINVIPGSTGIEEPIIVGDISVYPNPATDFVSTIFNLSKETNVSLSMINLAGKVVYVVPAKMYQAGANEIRQQTSGLAKGMYIIEIQSEGFIKHQKIVIE